MGLFLPKRIVRAVVGVTAAFAACSAAAEIHFSVGPSLEYTSNALKTAQNEISEQRYSINALLRADVETPTVKLLGDYSLSRSSYSEDSQDDKNSIRGSLTLTWEQIARALSWELSSSSARVLRNNTGSVSNANSEDRRIHSVAAILSSGDPADYITLTPRFTQVNNQESSENDSTRKSLTASFTHAFSPLTKISVALAREDVDSDLPIASADYDKTSYSVMLRRELRRISYHIGAGSSSVSRRGLSDYDSTNWDLSVVYDYGTQRFAAAASRSVSDTSTGDGNLRISGISANDAGELQLDISRDPSVSDIVVLTRYGFDWQDEALCRACTLAVSLDIDNSEFVSRNESDEEIVASWDFRRQVSSSSAFGFLMSPSRVDFSGARDDADYKGFLIRASADRTLSEDVSVYMRIQREERNGDSFDYDVNSAVVGFNWELLR